MNRIFTALVTLFVFLFAAVGAAQAATMSLTSSATSVAVGQTFTVTVLVDAGSTKISTVKAAVSYPEAILTPTSFAFTTNSPTWIPLSQSGYDSMTGGTVIKTAGFPGGFTGVETFGTITFTAKAAGSAVLAVTNQALAYDPQSNNALSGTQGSATITVTAPTPAPTAQQTTLQATTHAAPAQTTQPAKTATAAPTATAGAAGQNASAAQALSTTSSPIVASPDQNAGSAQVAAAAGAGRLVWAWIIFGIIVLLGLIWWFWRRPRRF